MYAFFGGRYVWYWGGPGMSRFRDIVFTFFNFFKKMDCEKLAISFPIFS